MFLTKGKGDKVIKKTKKQLNYRRALEQTNVAMVMLKNRNRRHKNEKKNPKKSRRQDNFSVNERVPLLPHNLLLTTDSSTFFLIFTACDSRSVFRAAHVVHKANLIKFRSRQLYSTQIQDERYIERCISASRVQLFFFLQAL